MDIKEERYLTHHGVKGMKWGVRRNRKFNSDDNVIKKGTEIHRMVPDSWYEKEKTYSGHAYASYKKKDITKYREIAKLFGDGSNYIDMTFKVKDVLIGPSKRKRVDEFIKLIDSNEEVRNSLIKSTRTPFLYVSKKNINNIKNIDDRKKQKVYDKFTYLLASKRSLRDPYFKQLSKQGYNFIQDDADAGRISESPIIVFDRSKSLTFKNGQTVKDADRRRDINGK